MLSDEVLKEVNDLLASAFGKVSNWPNYYSANSAEGKALWNKQIAISRAMGKEEE
jgi:hypothetical protein